MTARTHDKFMILEGYTAAAVCMEHNLETCEDRGAVPGGRGLSDRRRQYTRPPCCRRCGVACSPKKRKRNHEPTRTQTSKRTRHGRTAAAGTRAPQRSQRACHRNRSAVCTRSAIIRCSGKPDATRAAHAYVDAARSRPRRPCNGWGLGHRGDRTGRTTSTTGASTMKTMRQRLDERQAQQRTQRAARARLRRPAAQATPQPDTLTPLTPPPPPQAGDAGAPTGPPLPPPPGPPPPPRAPRSVSHEHEAIELATDHTRRELEVIAERLGLPHTNGSKIDIARRIVAHRHRAR